MEYERTITQRRPAYISVKNASVDFALAARELRRSVALATSGRFTSKKRSGSRPGHHMVVEALHNISLEFKEGDRVGLIGTNGSGKTTLLRVLAGIYAPTSGHCLVQGRVVPLLTTDMGIMDNITGWDNILLSGTFFHMSPAEIDVLRPQIAEFSELGEFLDLPVRTYSSGMRARLAFSIATAFNPDVLLIDEVFGTGDASFAQKAAARMSDLMLQSRILVFASHSRALLEQFCEKAVLLDRGHLIATGSIKTVFDEYSRRQGLP